MDKIWVEKLKINIAATRRPSLVEGGSITLLLSHLQELRGKVLALGHVDQMEVQLNTQSLGCCPHHTTWRAGRCVVQRDTHLATETVKDTLLCLASEISS